MKQLIAYGYVLFNEAPAQYWLCHVRYKITAVETDFIKKSRTGVSLGIYNSDNLYFTNYFRSVSTGSKREN